MRTGVERLRGAAGCRGCGGDVLRAPRRRLRPAVRIIGRPLEKGPFHGNGAWLTLSSGYFDVFKIPVKRGRGFTDRDDALAPGVVIINEAMAKQYWKDKDPVGERLMIGAGVMKELSQEREREIIGVVSDVRDGGLNNEPCPHMYVPNAQVPDALNALNVRITPVAWVVRTRGEPYAHEQRDSGAAPTGERAAGLGHQIDGRSRLAVDLATAVQRAADDRLRRVGAAACGDRHLRPDGVLGGAAHAGDRDPHRAWRRGCAGPAHGRRSRDAAGGRRRRPRARRGLGL